MPEDNHVNKDAAGGDAAPVQEILQNVPFPHKLELTGTQSEIAESWTHFKDVWEIGRASCRERV
jgi:hypothetical protein